MQADENMAEREKQLRAIEGEVAAEVERVNFPQLLLLSKITIDGPEARCQMLSNAGGPWLRLSHYKEVGVGESWRPPVRDRRGESRLCGIPVGI